MIIILLYVFSMYWFYKYWPDRVEMSQGHGICYCELSSPKVTSTTGCWIILGVNLKTRSKMKMMTTLLHGLLKVRGSVKFISQNSQKKSLHCIHGERIKIVGGKKAKQECLSLAFPQRTFPLKHYIMMWNSTRLKPNSLFSSSKQPSWLVSLLQIYSQPLPHSIQSVIKSRCFCHKIISISFPFCYHGYHQISLSFFLPGQLQKLSESLGSNPPCLQLLWNNFFCHVAPLSTHLQWFLTGFPFSPS